MPLTVSTAMQPSVAALQKQLEELKLQLVAAGEEKERLEGVIGTAKALQVTQTCKPVATDKLLFCASHMHACCFASAK